MKRHRQQIEQPVGFFDGSLMPEVRRSVKPPLKF
jgi:hypothetical protein